MIFLQIILIINTLVANISCTSFSEFIVDLQQKNSQLDATVHFLKNTVNENQATIQVLNFQIEKLEEKLNKTIDNMVQEKQLLPKLFENHCLSNSENYHLFDGRCIYFETRKFDYENAQRNCASKFSSGGKIFEPLTKSINDRVYGEFKQITGKYGWVWVGVTDEANEGVFRYASSGVPVSDDMRPEKPR